MREGMMLRTALSRGLGSALLALLVTALAGGANALATASLSVNGETPIAITLQTDGKVWYALDEVITGDDWSVEIDVVLDPDPSITYGLAVQNNSGGALSFSFLFSQNITPTSAPGFVNTSYSASTTNGGGGAGTVTITPAAPPFGTPEDGDATTETAVFNLSNDGGGTLFNAGIDLGQAFSSNPALTSDTAPPENSPVIAGPLGAGTYDFMQLDVNFTLSGGGDIATLNGSARVVPEPGTAALLGLGLLGIAYRSRRRAR